MIQQKVLSFIFLLSIFSGNALSTYTYNSYCKQQIFADSWFSQEKKSPFKPETMLERDAQAWLDKTIKECCYVDLKDKLHYKYLFYVLHFSLQQLHKERCKELLHSQNQDGLNYAHQVVVKSGFVERRLDLLKMFIYYGVNINLQNNNGDTALHLAYKINNLHIICYLESLPSINMHIKNQAGQLPSEQAICKKNHINDGGFWATKCLKCYRYIVD